MRRHYLPFLFLQSMKLNVGEIMQGVITVVVVVGVVVAAVVVQVVAVVMVSLCW